MLCNYIYPQGIVTSNTTSSFVFFLIVRFALTEPGDAHAFRAPSPVRPRPPLLPLLLLPRQGMRNTRSISECQYDTTNNRFSPNLVIDERLTLRLLPQNVIDSDLCEQYNMVDAAKQRSISDDLDKTPNELSKRLEDIRTRYAF